MHEKIKSSNLNSILQETTRHWILVSNT